MIKILKKDGWFEFDSTCDHHHFKHATKKGKVTVPHPKKDLPKPTVRNISKQSVINLY
ncbi:MAG: type II toxin-antitoxin system HicA family toxin [Clostridium sp.]|uniref:type II toxin-antitoxin system HicA family toxin n=1 Tax=Clostridium TaxID=1485 RepID=UPI002330FD47|nr:MULTISPECIES: type II toxin-antitoxin system HicA family toxin [Clostridium]MDB2122304.1 type II toxin-antitoxin system HicA family toxin [Clostridium paraputrificum]MDU4429264.1 type II toxin-antitoxin system HicA family toxin [Clostridium sp.]MDU7462543.1 type II toxin-antitoxin system HicA family toxin [Clostridium sp.]MDU7757605.1 type II toxin-antitoxin system HicA family toxin [Staphylococcus epidermidis]